MKRITEEIIWIPGQDEFIPDSHMYVLGDIEGEDITLIDAGLMRKSSYKLKVIEGLGIALSQIRRIILTHTHLDHIGCLPELKRKIPDMEVWVHEQEAIALENGDERTVYGMNLFKTMAQAQFGLKDGLFKIEVQRKLKEGDRLNLGRSVWEVMHLPGHSKGSIGLYEPTSRILISGDTIYSDFAIGRFDLFGADAGELRNSLSRLQGLEIDVLLPGHNDIMEAVPRDYVKKVYEQWQGYLR
jgi:glyoxylase-like metal-dependent hydrolase (beta-lactamase superfamily II)